MFTGLKIRYLKIVPLLTVLTPTLYEHGWIEAADKRQVSVDIGGLVDTSRNQDPHPLQYASHAGIGDFNKNRK